MEDPSFLYLVVMSMTQGLRRGELCGLMWKDINWETKRVTICHNRVQLVTKDTVKLPKREKVREIELHNAGSPLPPFSVETSQVQFQQLTF